MVSPRRVDASAGLARGRAGRDGRAVRRDLAPAAPPAADTGPVASPCTGVCAVDARHGWCRGCLRTLDEIAAWGAADAATRRAILARLPARRDAAADAV